jgi:hypothetical protein
MPLRASVNGCELISSLLSDDEWRELRDQSRRHHAAIVLPCCQSAAHTRVSKKGVRHFVHTRRDGCATAPETAIHLLAKHELVLGCRDAGYFATTEVAGDGWRADVLAQRGNVRVAFELQWSPQTIEETLLRQSRYEHDKIRCCWLFRRLPEQLKWQPKKEVPAFRVLPAIGDRLEVELNHESRSLRKFAAELLSRRLRFCESIRSRPAQRLDVGFHETQCWRCQRKCHIYAVRSSLLSCCGESMSLHDEFMPQVIEAVKTFLNTRHGAAIRMARVKERYSKTMRGRYLSFGCYYCDALFGEFYLRPELMHFRCCDPLVTTEAMVHMQTRESWPHPHWCVNRGHGFCDV